MPLILTLDAALAAGSVGLVRDDVELLCVAVSENPAAALPGEAARALAYAGGVIDRVAVTVGPGSFTGLRAAIALAHGIGLGAGVPVTGVTVPDAMAVDAPPGFDLWTAIDSKRGTVFLARGGTIAAVTLATLPTPVGPVAIVGDAAQAVAAALVSQGALARVLPPMTPSPRGIAAAVADGRTCAPLPLYIDPPLARPGPAPRPPPA